MGRLQLPAADSLGNADAVAYMMLVASTMWPSTASMAAPAHGRVLAITNDFQVLPRAPECGGD